MKNKKLLAALVALMIPVVSMAQTAFKGQFLLSHDDNVINHGETLNITP